MQAHFVLVDERKKFDQCGEREKIVYLWKILNFQNIIAKPPVYHVCCLSPQKIFVSHTTTTTTTTITIAIVITGTDITVSARAAYSHTFGQ